jgi:hypothetical protein|tara:strand:+ start:597 stop:812 length:216 start_codon:yes stop_codon:yes gene_type:complete
MDKKLERNIILTLAIILIILGLFGCAKPNIDANKEKPITTMDTIGNLEKIGEALGCVFASSSPACEEKKEK